MIATSKIKKITLPGDTPKCDLCVATVGVDLIHDKGAAVPIPKRHVNDAEFDMPTIYGSWGYVCRDHLESHVAPGAYETGTHITWTG
jgi:hypothetical protein